MQGKEKESTFGLNRINFGARTYNPTIGRFDRIDPLAEKYQSISLYTYTANNPIINIDPNGKEIIGVTAQDAQKFKQDINLVLADKKFEAVRALIDLKGSTFKSIDSKALSNSLNGVSLSTDERAYIDVVTNTINSTEVHKIEYLEGATTSSEGATAFKDHMNTVQKGIGDAMVRDGQLSTTLIEGLGKEGFNVPTNGGSHSFISGKVEGNERASTSTSAHEVFGHGIPSSRGLSPGENNSNAIRADNLIRRLLGMPQRDGSDHGGYDQGHITDPQKLPITQ